MFKTGSIRKIEVKNFVTYNYVELYPGPNLNMLVGPNGTGKSTIVAAIILGLGGNPKVVGRGTKVSEYVKHGCNEASINIYLQEDGENAHVKITRIITKQDHTSWQLNNRQVRHGDVVEYIKGHNIQVDNLCQFLPQDRVQEFAKLNQQQLLKETQIALCREDLIEKQNTLIESRDTQKKLVTLIEKSNKKLQEDQDANVRLEGKVENYNKKKKFMSKIQDIERKAAWVLYDKLYEKLTETRNDLKKATQVYEDHKRSIRPVEDDIRAAKNLVTQLQQTNSNVTRSIREIENVIRANLEKVDQTNENINKVVNNMNLKILEIEQAQEEINATAAKVEEMKVTQRELVDKCGNDQEMQEKVATITTDLQKFRRHVSGLQDKKEQITGNKQNSRAQLRACENELARLENIKQKRLDFLQRVDRHAYEGVLWLRENKQLFKGEIFEPSILELNVLDPNKAKFVESIIPMRDRVAFTCTLKEDMNNLIRYLRNEKKLSVNIVYSENTNENASSYQPSMPIEQLRQFGFYTHVRALFNAPDPIVKYLCKMYRVHDIPVGTDETEKYSDRIPKQITKFFSEKQRYSVNFSRYSGEKSIRQDRIQSDGGFSITMDVLRLQNLRGQINDINNDIAEFDNQIAGVDNQVNLINGKISKLSEEFKQMHSLKQQAQTIETRISALKKKIAEARQSVNNVEDVKNKAKRNIQKLVLEISHVQGELKTSYKSLTTYVLKNTLNSVKIEGARKNVSALENKIKETRIQIATAETTVNTIKEVYVKVKGQSKAGLQKAKGLSKNYTPEDDGFDEFREAFDQLSDDLEKLQGERNQLETKIECLNTADDREMREYEERMRSIADSQENIEKAHVELSKLTSKMETLEKQWLSPLNQLIMEMNLKFASAFERMGCAGEVTLNVGTDDKEYSNYGLCIKVTYRNGEPLQELNGIVQSGGERAVATAAFMLSLQELTPVPFRCVDEINQGMDANNERRIFDLLVETTSQANTSQYFLITPKIVPNLRYSRSTTIHIVHNGPFIEQDRKWSMSRLCNPQRAQLR